LNLPGLADPNHSAEAKNLAREIAGKGATADIVELARCVTKQKSI
jgi:hypothetical protein